VSTPLKVGLIGAGPWAKMVTGPVLAAGPETVVTGVWSRTAANAMDLATQLGVEACASVDELLDGCDAVAIAVAPDAQPEFAITAARAGKTLLLEKPLAADLAGAQRVVDAVDAAGVGTLVMLSNRFNPALESFLEECARIEPLGGRACFISAAFLGGPFAYGWRLEQGAVLDVGPHLLDLLEAALGEIVDVTAAGDPLGWTSIVCTHASGITSSGAICCSAAAESQTEVAVYGRKGSAIYDGRVRYEQWPTNVRTSLVAAHNGEQHPASAHHALHLQALIERMSSS
jgi:predicted dehydrogenase